MLPTLALVKEGILGASRVIMAPLLFGRLGDGIRLSHFSFSKAEGMKDYCARLLRSDNNNNNNIVVRYAV